MIIKGLLSLIMGIMNLIPLSIPSLPEDFTGFLEQFKTIISSGASFVASLLPYSYLMTLLRIFLAIEAAFLVYKFVMWVIRKIPMASVKD